MTTPPSFKAKPDAMVVQYHWVGFPEGTPEAAMQEWTGAVPVEYLPASWLAPSNDDGITG